jgi:hypothetical protein
MWRGGFPEDLHARAREQKKGTRLPDSYGSACQIVQRHNPGDLFLAREDGQPSNASLPHGLFSLFDVLVLEATNEIGTHVIAHGRRVGVMPVSGGAKWNTRLLGSRGFVRELRSAISVERGDK